MASAMNEREEFPSSSNEESDVDGDPEQVAFLDSLGLIVILSLPNNT